jgi:hypothetical protein
MSLMTPGTERSVSLLEVERSWLLMEEPGIASINFYRGNLERARERIRARMKGLVNANPWLVGRLVRSGWRSPVELVYPLSQVPEELFEKLFHPDENQIRIGSDMPYESLCERAATAIVANGHRLINRNQVVCRVALVPDSANPTSGFALIFSLSHIAADGYTYYYLLNELLSDGEIRPMRAERSHAASSAVAEAVGQKEYKHIFSLPFLFNAMKGMLLGGKATCHAYFVDDEKIEALKLAQAARAEDEAPFISTNDILTSSFIRVSCSRLCMSAINLRGRIDGISMVDAGNYEAALLYDDLQAATPQGVRATLLSGPPFKPTAKALPGVREGMFCNLGLITNWATFAGNLELSECEQVLHLPLHSIKKMPFDCAIIFTPATGRTAVMYFLKRTSREQLLQGCELGDPVSRQLFQ